MKKLIFAVILSFICCANGYSAQKGDVAKHIVFKGLNTKAGPLSLQEGESPRCLNVHSNLFGSLLKRSGRTALNTHPVTHPTSNPSGNGLFDFAIDSSTRKLVGYFGNVLHKMDNLDGTWDIVAGGTGSNLHDNIVSFENFDGILLFATGSNDYIQRWNGVESTTCTLAAPKGKYIIKAYNRVFVSGISSYPLRFFYSATGSYQSYDQTNDFESLDASQGDEARGWGLLRGRLFGFTKYTVNLISNLGGDPLLSIRKVLDGVGCGAPRSICVSTIPELGESLIWLTQDKRIVAYNGSQLKIISERISADNFESPVSMPKIDASAMEKSHAIIYENKGWYVLFIPISTSIDYAIIWDYKTDTIWAFDNQELQSSCLVETSSGKTPYVLDNTGYAYEWDDGSTSDNGESINGTWISSKLDFGWSPILKKGRQLWLATKTIGNYNLSYEYRLDWETSWSTAESLVMYGNEWLLGDVLPATLGGGQAKFQRKDIDYNFNLFQVRLSNNSTNPLFQIYSLDLLVSSTGSIQED